MFFEKFIETGRESEPVSRGANGDGSVCLERKGCLDEVWWGNETTRPRDVFSRQSGPYSQIGTHVI